MILEQSLSIQYYEELLARTKSQQMSGRLIFKGIRDQNWCLYFQLGRIVYARGGNHHVRRFYRQMQLSAPEFDWQASRAKIAENISQETLQALGWDFECLRYWYEQQLLTREQIHQIASSITLEVLFDIFHEGVKDYEYDSSFEFLRSSCFSLNDPIRMVQAVQQHIQKWDAVCPRSLNYTPNDAPVIVDEKKLIEHTSIAVYKSLQQLINGDNTLRDLATVRKRAVSEVTQSLMPYVNAKWVEFKSIADLPSPEIAKFISSPLPLIGNNIPTQDSPSILDGAMIACVDDSELVCLTMDKIFKGNGFKFVSIRDSLRAIPKLLMHKPDLIFLDLVMPHTNGYEICSQLRQLSLFKKTPIIILTGNDGIVDRVRAKLIGATDFLSKPVDAQTVLAVTVKHLNAVKFQA